MEPLIDVKRRKYYLEYVTLIAAILLLPEDPPIVNVTDVAVPSQVPSSYVTTSVVMSFEPSLEPKVSSILLIL